MTGVAWTLIILLDTFIRNRLRLITEEMKNDRLQLVDTVQQVQFPVTGNLIYLFNFITIYLLEKTWRLSGSD